MCWSNHNNCNPMSLWFFYLHTQEEHWLSTIRAEVITLWQMFLMHPCPWCIKVQFLSDVNTCIIIHCESVDNRTIETFDIEITQAMCFISPASMYWHGTTQCQHYFPAIYKSWLISWNITHRHIWEAKMGAKYKQHTLCDGNITPTISTYNVMFNNSFGIWHKELLSINLSYSYINQTQLE